MAKMTEKEKEILRSMRGNADRVRQQTEQQLQRADAQQAKKKAEQQAEQQDEVLQGNKQRAREQSQKLRDQKVADSAREANDRYRQASQNLRKAATGSSYAAASQARQKDYEKAQEEFTKARAAKVKAEEDLLSQQKSILARRASVSDEQKYQKDAAELGRMPEADREAIRLYNAARDVEFYNRILFEDPLWPAASPSDAFVEGLKERLGKGRLDELANTQRRIDNQAVREQVAEAGTKFGEEHPVFGSLVSLASKGTSGMVYGIDAARDISMNRGYYRTADPNLLGNTANVFSGAVEEAVTKDMSDAGKFVYQVAMGLGDIAVQSVIGPSADVMMGMRGFSEGFQSAAENGASEGQALLMGAGQAALEAAIEKIPLDQLLKVFKGGAQPVGQLIWSILKQSGIEVTTEVAGLAGTWLWEAAVMQDDSSYKKQINDLVINGASYEDAKEQVNQQRLQEIKQTAHVSMATGGISYAGSYALSSKGHGDAQMGKDKQDVVSSAKEKYAKQATQTEAQPPAAQPTPSDQVRQPSQQPAPAPIRPVQPVQAQPAPAAQPVQTQAPQPVNKQSAPSSGLTPEAQAVVDGAVEFVNREQPKAEQEAMASEEAIRRAADEALGNVLPEPETAVAPASDEDIRRIIEGTTHAPETQQRSREAKSEEMAREREKVRVEQENKYNDLADSLAALNDKRISDGGFRSQADKDAYWTARNALEDAYDEINHSHTTQDIKNEWQEQRAAAVLTQAHGLPGGSLHASADFGQHGTFFLGSDVQGIKGFVLYADGTLDIADINAYIKTGDGRTYHTLAEFAGNGLIDFFDFEVDGQRIEDAGSMFALSDGSPYVVDSVGSRAKVDTAPTLGNVAGKAFDVTEKGVIRLRKISDAEKIYYSKDLWDSGTEDLKKSRMVSQNAEQQAAPNPQKQPEQRNRESVAFDSVLEDMGIKQPQPEAPPVNPEPYPNQPVQEADGENKNEDHRSPNALREGAQAPDANVPKTTSETGPGAPQEVPQASDAKTPHHNAQSRVASAPDTMDTDQEAVVSPEIESAARQNADINNAAQDEQPSIKPGIQRPRATDVRKQKIPVTDSKGQRVSETAGNIYGSGFTPDNVAAEVKKLAKDGAMGYDVKHNDDFVRNAQAKIAERNLTGVASDVRSAVDSGKVSDQDVATAITAYITAVKSGDTSTAADLAVDLTAMGNMAGRTLQMFRILRMQTPEGQYKTAKRGIDRSIDSINKDRRGKDRVHVEYDAELESMYVDAARGVMEAEAELESLKQSGADKKAVAAARKELDNEQNRLDGIHSAMVEYAAVQIKSTNADIWNAWRNMAMLFNSKTVLRNVGGNVAMKPVWFAKKAIAAGIEKAFVKDKSKRTTEILGFSADDQALRAFAKQDVQSVAVQRALESGKFGDEGVSDALQSKRGIFKNSALEAGRKATGWLLNNDLFGDAAFKNSEYVASFGGYLKAQGYTAADIQNGTIPEAVIDSARKHAVDQALTVTFNDANRISKFVTNLRVKDADNFAGQAVNAMIDSNLPFKKVPANILARAYDMSPLGVAGAVSDYRKGKINANQLIDRISRGITGAGAAGLGAILAGGIGGIRLRGGDVSEEEKRAGAQPYSLEWVDEDGKIHSGKLSWLGAATLPMFIGVGIRDVVRAMGDADEDGLEAFFKSSGGIIAPLIEMSMLEGLKNTAETINDIVSEDQSAVEGLITMVSNYFLQAIPTTGRAVENTILPNEMMTYADADTAAGRALQRAASRIPGVGVLTGTRIEKRDEWGDPISKGDTLTRATNAFLNPFETTVGNETPVEKEIADLNASGGTFSLSDPKRKITFVDELGANQERRLSGDEFSQYSEVLGRTREELMTEAMADPQWSSYSTEQKQDAFEDAQTTAHETAKASIIGMPGFSDAVNQEVASVAKQTGNATVYYTAPTNSISYTDKTGADVKRQFTQQEYDTYRKVQEDTYSTVLSSLLNDSTYKKLSPENRAAAMKYAKEYATERAREQAISDYYRPPEDWVNDITTGTASRQIAQKVETEVFNRAADSWADDVARGFDADQSNADLQKAFDDYAKMSVQTRNAVKENVDGNTRRYLEARESKASHEGTTKVMQAVIESGANTNSYNAYKVIAETAGKDYALADTLMMAYMPDDDNREEKYNAARKDLGLSPVEFVQSKELYDGITGKGAKNRRIQAFMSKYDLSKEDATAMYYLWQNFTTYQERYR